MSTTVTRPTVGLLLRDWRLRRRMSQLALSLEAGVSARHLSFVETGRSRPSQQMILHTHDVAPSLLQPPVNVLRLSLHPEGLAPRIVREEREVQKGTARC